MTGVKFLKSGYQNKTTLFVMRFAIIPPIGAESFFTYIFLKSVFSDDSSLRPRVTKQSTRPTPNVSTLTKHFEWIREF